VSIILLQGLAIDDNVIKINNNAAIKEWIKYIVYEGAKCGRCISEAKGHDKNSYDPYHVTHAIFGSSPSAMKTW